MFWSRTKENKNNNSKKLVNNQTPAPNHIEPVKKSSHSVPLAYLKRLIPIGNLADANLLQIKIEISHHQPGDIIFKHSKASDSLTYIFKGKCFIETSNGSGYEIDASTFKSYYPLSSDSEYHCTAIAKSDVSILHFPQSFLRQSAKSTRNPLINIEDIPEDLLNNLFFNSFCQHFKQNKLVIPNLPDVAFKLRAAVQKEIGIKEAVKIVNLDPVISSKLIQIVNSPLFRTVNPIISCHDAITRLGLATTRNLVTSISMQNLFTTKNIQLQTKIHNLWKQSIHVSSISYTLATLCKKINPDEALLAGLIHNLGALPIIIFANNLNNDEYSSGDIERSINTLQGLLGNIILEKWGFPESLSLIPRQTENWYHNNDDQLELSDIVILAKFHSYIGSPHMQKLPLIYTLPAFQKLGDNTLSPDMSLKTLHDAKQQIAEAISLFGT